VASLFYEAQRLDHFGRHNKAAEFYQIILKRHPKLDKVREVKTEEWRKTYLHVPAFLNTGIKKVGTGREHLREIIRLIRGNGREGMDEGKRAFTEILTFVPANSLVSL
jgi:hypothetical protein